MWGKRARSGDSVGLQNAAGCWPGGAVPTPPPPPRPLVHLFPQPHPPAHAPVRPVASGIAVVCSPWPGRSGGSRCPVGIKSPVNLPQPGCPEPTTVYGTGPNSHWDRLGWGRGGGQCIAQPGPLLPPFLQGLLGLALESWKVAHYSLSG